jgi:rubrerythrin
VSEKGRERIIKDIETLDQAVKAEKDVESGYHGVIDENISYWLAVEQDIVDSYTKLANQSEDKKAKSTLTKIVEDSENHIRMLTSIRKTFDKIMEDEHRHAKLLEELADRQHK